MLCTMSPTGVYWWQSAEMALAGNIGMFVEVEYIYGKLHQTVW